MRRSERRISWLVQFCFAGSVKTVNWSWVLQFFSMKEHSMHGSGRCSDWLGQTFLLVALPCMARISPAQRCDEWDVERVAGKLSLAPSQHALLRCHLRNHSPAPQFRRTRAHAATPASPRGCPPSVPEGQPAASAVRASSDAATSPRSRPSHAVRPAPGRHRRCTLRKGYACVHM